MVRTYSPEGRTPVVDEGQTRDHLSVRGGRTPAGKVYVLVRPESLKGLHTVAFLQHLLRYAGRRLLVIWDRSMIHRRAEVKAFFMKRDPSDSRLALCVDVLAPEGYGEVIGGGQREDSLEVLEASIRQHDLPMEAFGWYLDLRRYGSAPHAGFGMGIERCVTWLCGLHHVRETIPFPRMLERLRP